MTKQQLQAIIDELERRAEWHRANQNDPHNIGTAVYATLTEVAGALRKVMNAKINEDDDE